jgi:hypothetical protein
MLWNSLWMRVLVLMSSLSITAFFGCRYGEHSDGPVGWGRVRYDRGDAIPEMTTCSKVVRLRIVMDEGTDTPRTTRSSRRAMRSSTISG